MMILQLCKSLSGTNFTTFEGGAVRAGTSGYLLIDKEIISYTI